MDIYHVVFTVKVSWNATLHMPGIDANEVRGSNSNRTSKVQSIINQGA